MADHYNFLDRVISSLCGDLHDHDTLPVTLRCWICGEIPVASKNGIEPAPLRGRRQYRRFVLLSTR